MAAPVVAPAAAALGAVGKLSCEPPARAGRVLLYDGVCNLCNTSLAFIAKRDPNKNVMFCSIQSDAAQPYLHAYMRHPWPLLRHLQAVPVPLRDSVYSLVAVNRYHLFGRSSMCQVPPPDLLDRFVDRDELLAGTTRTEIMEEDK